ncbi:MAG: fprB [Frankiales bacterium]|nr:fprB [Frankiales bacterium]
MEDLRVAGERLRVAVVGAGPSGLYVADELSRRGGTSVDILDRLPCPYGLLRYGVAPDHLKMKSLVATLEPVLGRPGIRFIGNAEVGTEVGNSVTVDELREAYHAVVYATGASRSRRLCIPGEELPGSFASSRLVAWYNAHPDEPAMTPLAGARAAIVVGAGNVALDLVRMLLGGCTDLRLTDVPDDVVDSLRQAQLSEVHLVARGTPAQAKFTTKELRDLDALDDVDLVVHATPAELDAAAADGATPVAQRNLRLLGEWARRPLRGARRTAHLHFGLIPTEVLGTSRVEGLRLQPAAGSAAVSRVLPAQVVVSAIGYQGRPIAGAPFEAETATIPNIDGRVQRDGSVSPGEYATGWVRRGPSGVIGTNKLDALQVVERILEDLPILPPPRTDRTVPVLLAARGLRPVEWDGWLAIDREERRLGQARGTERVKVRARADLHGLADAAAGSSRPLADG